MKKLTSEKIEQYFTSIYRKDAENTKQKNLNKYAIFPAIYVIWKYARNDFIDYQTLQAKLLEEFKYNIESSYHFSQDITQTKGDNIVTDNARFLQDLISFKVDKPSELKKDPDGYYYSKGLPKTGFKIQPDNLDALGDIIETFKNDHMENITNYMKKKRAQETTKYVAIIPNDPTQNNARLELEENSFYKGWGGKLNCIIEEGQFVILYISGNIQQYQYLCRVTKINKDNKTFDIELIKKFDEDTSKQFSRKKLLELGLAPRGVIRYCLDKYPKICEYVSSILIEKQIINEPFWCEQTNTSDDKEQDMTTSSNDNAKIPLNQILYGPPGTGKTYNTINKALEIIFEKEDSNKQIIHKFNNFKFDKKVSEISEILKKENHSEDERKILTAIFDYYAAEEQGQVEFVTFHQSYGYEEFVEGIKASTNDKNEVIYQIENGSFKEFCEKAKTIKTNHKSIYDFDEKINIWKISLGDSQNSEEDYLFDYCINNNKILLGFGDGLDFNGLNDRKSIAKKLKDTEKYSYPPTAINTLKNKIKKDDIVLVSYGNKKLRAIAKIVGDYEFLQNEELNNYVQSRTVEWLLVPEEPFIYEKILKKQFSQMSIYDIKNNVKIEKLKNLLTYQTNEENFKNYVFIIDEINRGNISKIFGELITLIEESKRIGNNEALELPLPYSGEPFGVPSNLYIIGTMNTADRSIALMDTALRRRFDFVEKMPETDKLEKITVQEESDGKKGVEIDLKGMLSRINQRIEYLYDRDHQIGHTYFLGINDLPDLASVFRNRIIPLLKEYFYDNWEKIRLVLADNQRGNEREYQFVTIKQDVEPIKLFGDISEEDIDFDDEKKVYEINMDAFKKPKSYIKIYNPIKDSDNGEDESNGSIEPEEE